MTNRTVQGAHAVVTGGGSGIGRGIALALAARGADVVVADVDLAAAEQVAIAVRDLGRQARAVQTDVTRLDSVHDLADAAYETFGTVEILVNNAGVALRPYRASWDTSPEDFEWVMGVNLWGVLNMHMAFVPRMLETDGFRHILNTSSMSNVIDSAGASAYAASKGAVTAFSIAAATEMAPKGIGLTILVPGHVATALATSERLRPEPQRSVVRGVTPYENAMSRFVTENAQSTLGGAPETSPTDLAINTPLDPVDVGHTAVRAILANDLFCLTHQPPEDQMRSRTELMIASYKNP